MLETLAIVTKVKCKIDKIVALTKFCTPYNSMLKLNSFQFIQVFHFEAKECSIFFEDMGKLKIRILGAQLFGQYCQSQVKRCLGFFYDSYFLKKKRKQIYFNKVCYIFVCFDKYNPNSVSLCCQYSNYYYQMSIFLQNICKIISVKICIKYKDLALNFKDFDKIRIQNYSKTSFIFMKMSSHGKILTLIKMTQLTKFPTQVGI